MPGTTADETTNRCLQGFCECGGADICHIVVGEIQSGKGSVRLLIVAQQRRPRAERKGVLSNTSQLPGPVSHQLNELVRMGTISERRVVLFSPYLCESEKLTPSEGTKMALPLLHSIGRAAV